MTDTTAAVAEKPDAAPAAPETAAPAADASTVPETKAADAPTAPDNPSDVKPKGSSILDNLDDDDEADENEGDKKPDAKADPAKDGDKPADGKDKPAAWPDDWRERAAGGDEKKLNMLKRLADPTALAKSYFALQQKLSSGEFKKAPSEDSTPEEWAAWRTEMGIPDAPDKYELPTVPDYGWTDADKSAATPLLERLHKVNAPQGVVNEVMGYYAEALKQAEETTVAKDAEDMSKADDHMRSSWGADFKPNVGLLKRALSDGDLIPAPLKEAILSARTPDGHRLANMPEVIDLIIGMARQTYGDGGMLYGDAKVQHNSRKQEIEKVMATDMDKYYRDGLYIEYADLLKKESGNRA